MKNPVTDTKDPFDASSTYRMRKGGGKYNEPTDLRQGVGTESMGEDRHFPAASQRKGYESTSFRLARTKK